MTISTQEPVALRENQWAAVLYGDWSMDGCVGSPTGTNDAGAHARLALLSAVRGDTTASRRFALLADTDPAASPSVWVGTALARGVCWLVDKNPEASWAAFAGLLDHRHQSDHLREAAIGVGLLAEAAIRTGRQLETRALLERLRGNFAPLQDARCQSELVFAQIVLGSAEDFENAGRQALEHMGDAHDWVRARLELRLGMLLRRHHRIKESRTHLESALEVFTRLEAAPWARSARSELRATGVGVQAHHTSLPLTPQERAIVELVANGCSNREIGQRLFLSPRTVSSHLYRIFPKLNITSRAQLGGLLESYGEAV